MAVVEGQRRFAAPPERVFALLTDPDVVASAMPAMRSHSVIDDDHWNAKVKPPLPFAPSITIRFEVLGRRPPEHAALHAHGGGADVTSTFDLAADGDGTLMHWRTLPRPRPRCGCAAAGGTNARRGRARALAPRRLDVAVGHAEAGPVLGALDDARLDRGTLRRIGGHAVGGHLDPHLVH
jgi:carbon monoxide dehydrogenase subunit G